MRCHLTTIPHHATHWKDRGYGRAALPTLVKNLGWLMKHKNEVHHFIVQEPATDPTRGANNQPAALLIAYDYLGPLFSAPFMSAPVLHRFLDRPSWRGFPVSWFGVEHYIGSTPYRDIMS